MQRHSSDLLIAYTLAKAKRYDDAIDLILADKGTCDSPEAIDLLARIYVETGKISEARELWQKIVNYAPNSEYAKRALASLGKKQHDFKAISILILSVALIASLAANFCFSAKTTPPQVVSLPREDAKTPAIFTFDNIPTQANLDVVAAELQKNPNAKILLESSFFSKNIAKRSVLIEIFCYGLKIRPEQLFVAEKSSTSPDGFTFRIYR